MFWVFCLLCAIVPFAILLPIALTTSSDSTKTALLIILIIMAGLGFLYLLFVLRKTLYGGVCCMPPAPELTGPWSRADQVGLGNEQRARGR